MIQDLRYAVRQFRRSPAFTIVAVLTLALGIGANTATFSVLDEALLQTLPVKRPDQLVFVTVIPRPGTWMSNVPTELYDQLRQSPRSFSDICAYYRRAMNLRSDGREDRIQVDMASGGYYSTLGVTPFLGRLVMSQEERSRVAVLSYAFWVRRFHADPGVVNKTVDIDGVPTGIIGVTPPEFFGAERGVSPDMTIPLGTEPRLSNVWIIARLKDDTTREQAVVEVNVALQRAVQLLRPIQSKEAAGMRAGLMPGDKGGGGLGMLRYAEQLKILIAVSLLVLLIGCMNVANLLLARSAARSSEIGIRLALGAGRGRLIRQLVTESALLSVLGAAGGTVLALWVHRALVWLVMGADALAVFEFKLNAHLLGFTAAVSVLCTLVFGLVPALRATRVDIKAALKNEWQARRGSAFARGLIVAQVAAALWLLFVAAMLARTFHNLQSVNAGFDADNLLTMTVGAPRTPYEGSRAVAFYRELADRIGAIPGVLSSGLAANGVFGGGWFKGYSAEGRSAEDAGFNLAGPGFFATTGAPLLMGRDFSWRDQFGSTRVAIINETFARRYFANESPIGRRIEDPRNKFEVIGVVKDARRGSLREPPPPMVYEALLQEERAGKTVVHLRSRGNAAMLAESVRQEIRAINKDLPVYGITTAREQVAQSMRREQMMAALAGFFGLLALLLTGIGIYGVIAYSVGRRTSEIGVRMALGATRVSLLWMILRETLVLVAAGALIGTPVALVSARVLKSFLYGVESHDPASVMASLLALLSAGILAGYLPARRAARLDPMAALREE